MKLKKTYKEFDTVILRTPLHTLSVYNDIPKKEEEVIIFIQNLFNDPLFKEGIYLASPELYYEWKKLVSGNDYPLHKKRHLSKSILKYYIRSITNCVPFGLFASYTILNRSELNRSEANSQTRSSKRYTRFSDVNISFLSSVIDQLHQHEKVQGKLTYHVNDTAYIRGTSCRYIESFKSDSGERNFTLSDLDADPVLQLVISTCKTAPKTKLALIQIILDRVEGVSLDEVTVYVEELIRSQIIVSSLDFSLNGKSPFSQIQKFLKENADSSWLNDDFLNSVVSLFNDVEKYLAEFNEGIHGNSIISYESLLEKINNSSVRNLKKNNVNTDLRRASLPKDFTQALPQGDKSLQEAICLMTMLSTRNPKKKYTSFKNLEAFKKAFIERYEDAEIPFLQVLDKETGIGYVQSTYDNNSSWLIDDLEFPETSLTFEDISCDLIADRFWFKSILKALDGGKTVIDLKQEDLSAFENRTSKLTGTFPMVYTSSGGKTFITSAGGSTALHYIGRFMGNDKELADFGKEISEIEDQLFPEKILAEITHLATYRAGNIAMRNVNRKYEIPVLGKASEHATKIDLDDLLLSVKGNQIIIRSKKYNKEVIPFLSCAQNFHYGTIPVYHFLCDLQSQYRPNLLSLDFSSIIQRHFNFIPRIEYDNKVVLFLARWRFSVPECQEFLDDAHSILYDSFQKFKTKHNIPRYINLSEEGSEPLTIDTENTFMVELIEERLKKSGGIHFTESMYDFSNQDDSTYANEYMVSLKGDSYSSTISKPKFNIEKPVKKSFIPGDEWLYFKLYTGVNIADKILSTAIKETAETLLEQGIIDKWFFIRYNDPKFHLRVRYHFTDTNRQSDIIDLFNKNIKPYIDNKSIWKVELATYERELDRYYHNNILESETIFFHDSNLTVDLLHHLRSANEIDSLWLYSLQSVDTLLDTFDISLQEKQDILFQFYKSFLMEFKTNKKVRKQIDLKFRNNIAHIEDILMKDHKYIYVFKKRIAEIKPAVESLKRSLSKAQIYDLIASHVHMCINRLIKANPRLHELVLYGILEKYYKRRIGLLKYGVKKEKEFV